MGNAPSGDPAAPERGRPGTWGSGADRAVMQAIAEDVTRHSGFDVCAIEVVRSDGMLEFVAIAGSPDGAERLLGQATPLAEMQVVFTSGSRTGEWVFSPGDMMDEHARQVMERNGHMPDLIPLESDGAWLAEDMFFACLRGVEGSLRAVVYLDLPHDGMRPGPARIAEVHSALALALEAAVNIVERESFGQQVRMVQAARRVIQEARARLGVEELLALVAEELPAGFGALRVAVTLAGRDHEGQEEQAYAMSQALRRAWRNGSELVVDGDVMWGDEEFADQYGTWVTEMFTSFGFTSSVLVPIGFGEEYLGVFSMARGEGMPRWSDSEIRGAHAVVGDIAGALVDARSVERERELNSQLLELDGYRRSMISTIAHELKNPVGVFTGHLELVSEADIPDSAHRSLSALRRAADRVESMAQNLVLLGQITDAEQPTIEVEVHLSALVSEVVDFMTVLAQGARVGLVVDVDDDIVVTGDPTELHRLVSNLISNAIKYTPAGGVVTIWLRPDESEEVVVFRCADTGIGLSAADQARVFEPFFRSEDTRARGKPGTGLGLAIVRQVVERHRGTIGVSSVLGLGTSFEVRLPTL